MHAAFLVAVVLFAEPSAAQLELLKTFRAEFISITPGAGVYPAVMTSGRSEGGLTNERPVHGIRLAYRFSIAKYEVPQNLWEAVMGSNPSTRNGPRNSCEMFSFDEAQQFCRQATAWQNS